MKSSYESVTSSDGTVVSYQTIGSGAGLIIIPGALSEAHHYEGLAQALSQRFTVHTIDRRGHGQSGPQGADYSIEKECEDLLALVEKTGARHLFGHSFGGLVALETALRDDRIEHLSLYEPGVSIDGSVPVDWVERCRAQLDRNDAYDAFVTFVRGMNPDSAGRLPRLVLKQILRVAMRKEERRQKCRLLPEAINEHVEAARLDNTYARYRSIGATVDLLTGGRGPGSAAARRTAATLATVLPHARVVTLPKLDHFGPEQVPIEVARTILSRFERAKPMRAQHALG